MATTRKFFVGGNWKCFGTMQSVSDLGGKLKSAKVPSGDIVELVVGAPFVYLEAAKTVLASSLFQVSAQNCWYEDKGAFTGEVSAAMLKDVGISWVILGHSERRHIIKESDEIIGKKTAAALKNGLSVILCVGELLEEREGNKTEEVIKSQLDAVKSYISDWTKIVIAYEPVWAIGTGKVATPQQAQEAHLILRNWISQNVSPSTASSTRIIYGGSVKPDNCVELSKKPDIDGFLVGGASLVADQFIPIVNSANDAQHKDIQANL
jgi:triosephosphate isomerase